MKFVKYLVFVFILYFTFFSFVNAEEYYYYQNDDGNYMLCYGSTCQEIESGENDVTFNLAAGQITYQNVVYKFSSVEQEKYNELMAGVTRMFYYLDSQGRYILCKKVGQCNRYTFQSLSDNGAIIMAGSNIQLSDGTIYYYNSKQSTNHDNEESITNNSNVTDIVVDDSQTCGRLKEPLMFIGNIVLIVKIAIPIIIVALGMMDFFKAITGAKDEEIKKSAKSFALRVAAGVIVFFIPTVISVVFSLISSWADLKGEFNACQKCILDVRSCE